MRVAYFCAAGAALVFLASPLVAAEQSGLVADSVDEVPSCVEVQVGDARSVSYGCLSQRLTPPKPKASHPDMPNPALASERVTRLPPTQTGLFTSLHQNLISGVKRSDK